MKTKTNYLAFLLLASALAGGSGQALGAAAKCGDYPEGACLTGDRCNRSGLWVKDSTCPIAIGQQGGQAEQKEKARAGQRGIGSKEIFDRWGVHKTKASCEGAGGGWIKSEGKASCKPRVDKASKQ